MCNNTLSLGPWEGPPVVWWLFNNLLRVNGASVQGEPWVGWGAALRLPLPPRCVFPPETPLRASSHGGRVEGRGPRRQKWEKQQSLGCSSLGKAKLALRLVGLKSGARCLWSCSPLGCRAASFQILYFCEKPGEGNAFISASSDAARTGAAQTCLEPRPLHTLLYPSVSPLVALGCVSNGNSRVMTELQDSRLCVCARADHNYPSPPSMIPGSGVRSSPWNHCAAIPCGSSSSVFKPRMAYCHVRV